MYSEYELLVLYCRPMAINIVPHSDCPCPPNTFGRVLDKAGRYLRGSYLRYLGVSTQYLT